MMFEKWLTDVENADMRIVLGNTFNHKEEIKSVGGKWDGQFWSVPHNVWDKIQEKVGVVEFLYEVFYDSENINYVQENCFFRCGDNYYNFCIYMKNKRLERRKSRKLSAMDCAPESMSKEEFRKLFP